MVFFFLKDFQAKGGEDRRCNFSFTCMHFQVFHPYLATLCILRRGILFEYTYINEWLELLLKHDSRAVFVSNKNRPAGAKLSKLGSALLQQVPTGATSTVSTVENGKGTAAGLKLEVNSCSFEGWRLRWSVNLRLETWDSLFALFFGGTFFLKHFLEGHKNIFTERSLKTNRGKTKTTTFASSRIPPVGETSGHCCGQARLHNSCGQWLGCWRNSGRMLPWMLLDAGRRWWNAGEKTHIQLWEIVDEVHPTKNAHLI